MKSRSPLGAVRIAAMLVRNTRFGGNAALLFLFAALLFLGFSSARAAAPVMTSWQQLDPSNLGAAVPTRNGDTVRIATFWDQDSLDVAADCSAISDGSVSVLRTAPKTYLIVHAIPSDNTRPDGNARIVLTASNADRDTTIENSPGVCLSNHPPRLERAFLYEPPEGAFTKGDTIQIASKWSSWDSTLFVTADFKSIQPQFTLDNAEDLILSGINFGDSLETTYHLTSFVVPFSAASPEFPEGRGADGIGLVIPLTAIDAGCGVTQDQTIRVDLDTAPPETLPQVDTLPLETTADSLRIEGVAPGAVRVSIWRNDAFQLRAAVNAETHRFSAMLKLGDDRVNKIYVKAEDVSRNPTLQSNVQFVTQVKTPGFLIPRPYRRDNPIVFRRLDGAREPELGLFDLEGSCVRVWKSQETVREYRFEWNGLDANGARAGQGMYLLRARWREPNGSGSHSETAAVFLRD